MTDQKGLGPKSTSSGTEEEIDKVVKIRKNDVEWSDPIEWPIGDLNYEIYDVIGRGGNAVVNLARCISNGRICAIKRVDLAGRKRINCAIEEVRVMSQLHHPYLATYSACFIYETEMWIVLDYYHFGSLSDIMKRDTDSKPGLFSERMIASLMKDVLRGLMYLHHFGIIHSDIKPGNILLRGDGSAVLSDFGSARHISNKRSGIVTTPMFRAPELVCAQFLTTHCDIWSVGMTAVNLSGESIADWAGHLDSHLAMYEEFAVFSDLYHWVTSSCLLVYPQWRLDAWNQVKHRFFRRPLKKWIIVDIVRGVPQRLISWRRERRPYRDHPQAQRFFKRWPTMLTVQDFTSNGWQIDTPRSTTRPNSVNSNDDRHGNINEHEGQKT